MLSLERETYTTDKLNNEISDNQLDDNNNSYDDDDDDEDEDNDDNYSDPLVTELTDTNGLIMTAATGEESSVCNISMMKIDDGFKMATTTTTNMAINNNTLPEHYMDKEAMETEDVGTFGDDDCDNDDESYKLAPLYINDLIIERNDEEQTITDLVRASSAAELIETGGNSSIRVAFGILVRLMLPLANGVARGIQGIRDVRFLRVLKNIASSRQALINLVAFAANTISMNLSSAQVSHRLEPLLKLLKLRRAHDGLESLPDTQQHGASNPATPIAIPTYSPFIREPNGSLPYFSSSSSSSKRKAPAAEQDAPNCCTLNIMAEPPAGAPIRADIVFIHGLHGSQVNTWKQGLWANERRPVEFERPPKPPVRPPKRPRHSRTSLLHMPPKQKRAKFTGGGINEHHKHSMERETHEEQVNDNETHGDNLNDFTYVCGEPKDIQIFEGIEYSFPTFRLRMNDNGHQLQANLETAFHDPNANAINDDDSEHQSEQCKQMKRKQSTKPSPDDPNYSKCWPGDWLPLDCPGVRVIALNYTTDQYLWRPLWKKKEARTNLVQRSREMAELLIKHRVGYGHPIIWVGHSKGGLFIKQIIVEAWESGRPAMAPFWRSARGCFFYSVPHRGSHLASIKAPLLTRSVELIDIEKNSKYLLDLHRRFAGLYHLGHLKIEVFSFVETALTLMSVLYLRIVGVDSADPGIGDVCGIRLDHREICKPRSRDCILYKELVKMINKVC